MDVALMGQKRLGRSLLLTLPLAVLSIGAAIMADMLGNTLSAIASFIGISFLVFCFFQFFYTGKTDKYRAILFITTAVLFPIQFIAQNYEDRGLFMVLSFEDILDIKTPFCHIGIVQTIGTILTKGIIVFPGLIDDIAGTIAFWLGYSLVLGRGWCGWGCFWGGWEEGFSRILRKPLIKKLNRNLTYIPFAVLLATVLTSTLTLSAQYCWWVCPFKAVSEFREVSTSKIVVQTMIFVALFVGLVIILPLLTKKRTQCAFLCPFGAMQSFTNKLSPFGIVIDTDKCIKCKRCIESCKMLSLNEKSLLTGKSGITCVRCGKCVDVCPKKAISYHIKGTKIGVNTDLKRNLFLYSALFLTILTSGPVVTQSLYRILLFVTTGSFIP